MWLIYLLFIVCSYSFANKSCLKEKNNVCHEEERNKYSEGR